MDSRDKPSCWDWLAIAILLRWTATAAPRTKISVLVAASRLRRLVDYVSRPWSWTRALDVSSHSWAGQLNEATTATYCRLEAGTGLLWYSVSWPGFLSRIQLRAVSLEYIRVGLDWLDEHP